jgi:hypothetical protein
LYMHLCDKKNLELYIDKLTQELIPDFESINQKQSKLNTSGYRVYAIVFDFHSTNSLCIDCRKLTHGLYPLNKKKIKDESDDDSDNEDCKNNAEKIADENLKEEGPFVKTVTNVLKGKGFNTKRPFKVLTRYSSDVLFPEKNNNKKNEDDNNQKIISGNVSCTKQDLLKNKSVKKFSPSAAILNKHFPIFTIPQDTTVYVSNVNKVENNFPQGGGIIVNKNQYNKKIDELKKTFIENVTNSLNNWKI